MVTESRLIMSVLFLRLNRTVIKWDVEHRLQDFLSNFWDGCLDEISHKLKSPAEDPWKVFFRRSDEGQNNFFIYPDEKRISYLHDAKCDTLELLSLSKELLTKLSLLDGMIWLHGSAFRLNGKTCMVLGRKGVGKTTWLLIALLRMKGQFLGNDQILLGGLNGIPYTRYWRPDIKVSPRTLELLRIPFVCKSTTERLLWFTSKRAAHAIDIVQYSKRRKQNLEICTLPPPAQPCEPTKNHHIDIVIIPNEDGPTIPERRDRKQCLSLRNQLERDPEVIMPHQLETWHLEKPFWTNRLTGLAATSEVCKKAKEFIKQLFDSVPVYHVHCRTSPDKITEFLMQTCVEEKRAKSN